ncbi:PAC2 family protein [Thalassiella azotivora]
MRSPRELYELDEQVLAELVADLPVQDEPAQAARGEGPVLLHALQGFVDAGSAASTAVGHLLAEMRSTPLARFDADQLVDYRARRPRMTFRQDRFESVEMPELVVHLVRDRHDRPFLVMTGPEPDTQWNRFAAAVVDLVERTGTSLTIGLHGIPWAAPHTRPVGLTPHASDRSLIAGRPRWVGDVEVPGHASALIELRLAQAGHRSMGFTAHVPHYLTGAEFPPASVALLEAVGETTELDLPTQRLRDAGVDVLAEIDKQVADAPETLEAVRGLERQYDAVAAGRSLDGPGLLNPSLPPEEMPDADALAADVERYLRELGGDSPSA